MSDYAAELAVRYVREWPEGAEFLGVRETIEGAVREALAKAAEEALCSCDCQTERAWSPDVLAHEQWCSGRSAVESIRALGAREAGR